MICVSMILPRVYLLLKFNRTKDDSNTADLYERPHWLRESGWAVPAQGWNWTTHGACTQPDVWSVKLEDWGLGVSGFKQACCQCLWFTLLAEPSGSGLHLKVTINDMWELLLALLVLITLPKHTHTHSYRINTPCWGNFQTQKMYSRFGDDTSASSS